MEDSVIVPDQEIAFPSEELESEESQAELGEAKAEEKAIATIALTPGWEILVKSIEEDIRVAGDITQLSEWDGNLQTAASLIGHAKFVDYVKGFKERVENAARESGSTE